ncbi:MAG TPA: hypothetical protein VN933_17340 [Candidatus Eremiobacteraceae bacterium]|jgi:hypothetical protein|nr:hypothetical protein [Candidatus Eremiobacteraceae bacterium]
MQVTVNIHDELAAQAREKGLSVEVYVEQILAEQRNGNGADMKLAPSESNTADVKDVIARMEELRKGVTLGGLNIKDLIHEGHKY